MGGHAQADRAALRLTLLSCSKRLVTTAAVDAEENTTMAEMLMAPAVTRESGQASSAVDLGWRARDVGGGNYDG